MNTKYFVAMACSVGEYNQSDELFLIKLKDNRIAGLSVEFEYMTCDIAMSCNPNEHTKAKWFGIPPEDQDWNWAPASLDDITRLKLEKYIIGSKNDISSFLPLDPL